MNHGERDDDINVGVMVAHSPSGDEETLQRFAAAIAETTAEAMKEETGVRWRFHPVESVRVPSDEPRRPSDLMDAATLRMVEGPYDMVVIVTDVGVVSRRQAVVAGLASPISRVAVLSTRKLLIAPRGRPLRRLESEAVFWNGAALLIHLLGHLLGMNHRPEGVMAPFWFDEDRRSLPRYSEAQRRVLARHARRAPERELRGGGIVRSLTFHVRSAVANAGQIIQPVLRSRAPLLPLSLPSLATAAVAPTFILIFTAEIWDVGLNMSAEVVTLFATLSILGATWYLTSAQNLFFPRKEKRVITEHMAVTNVSIFLVMLLAAIGLFLMLGLLMLFLELFIFPEGLITTWPTLEDPVVSVGDKIRLAAFMSTVGVLTGALAGGLDSRAVIRQLALFRDDP